MYINIHFQWIFTKLYLILKTIDDLKSTNNQAFYEKIAYIPANVLNVLYSSGPFLQIKSQLLMIVMFFIETPPDLMPQSTSWSSYKQGRI